MTKPRSPRFVRRNFTYPKDFEPHLERMQQVLGTGSMSETIRTAIAVLEVKMGFPALPAIADQMKKKSGGGQGGIGK